MMDMQHGTWLIHCDDCDEELNTEKVDKEEAEQVARTMGWTITRHHYCEQCTNDHEDEEDDQG